MADKSLAQSVDYDKVLKTERTFVVEEELSAEDKASAKYHELTMIMARMAVKMRKMEDNYKALEQAYINEKKESNQCHYY